MYGIHYIMVRWFEGGFVVISYGRHAMSGMQKFAWFNLAVIGLTLLVVFSLLPFLGYRAMGGLGCLGLLGIGPLFFRRQPGRVVTDERDHVIQARAWIFAYAVFWVVTVLVAAGLSAVVYGEDGAVPVRVVRLGVFWAFMLVYALASIAILVQYAGVSSDAQ
jgi:hypothetical protein